MFKEASTGAIGVTVVFDGTCQPSALLTAEQASFCVVTGVDGAGNVSDYNVVEGCDLRTYIAQEFSAHGLAHTVAYPANDEDHANHMRTKLQLPVSGSQCVTPMTSWPRFRRQGRAVVTTRGACAPALHRLKFNKLEQLCELNQYSTESR
jgi:hypothetical protein